jgi:hypothetical protein
MACGRFTAEGGLAKQLTLTGPPLTASGMRSRMPPPLPLSWRATGATGERSGVRPPALGSAGSSQGLRGCGAPAGESRLVARPEEAPGAPLPPRPPKLNLASSSSL